MHNHYNGDDKMFEVQDIGEIFEKLEMSKYVWEIMD